MVIKLMRKVSHNMCFFHSILIAKMVSDEHFGGFLTKKVEGKEGGPQKSWKERMEEIIAKSKKEKVGVKISETVS